jgi:IS5 family transposase
MIKYKSSHQLSLDGFSLPFGGKLNPDNRWVRWSEVIPWDELAVAHYETMDAKQGLLGKDARLVIAALIIKHKLTLSDEETVLQVIEGILAQALIKKTSIEFSIHTLRLKYLAKVRAWDCLLF